MNSAPKISVVMPFYNAENYIADAIESILQQSMKEIELIIINDASTDKSDEVVQLYLKDKRVVYIKNEKHCGIVHNLNLGIKISRADYIARMDGDDLCLKTRLEKQYFYLQNNPQLSMVGTSAKVINEGGTTIGNMDFPTDPNIIHRHIFFKDMYLHGTLLYKKNMLEAIGCYRPQFYVIEDNDLYLRMHSAGYRGANLSEQLYIVRKHNNNTDKKYREKLWLMLKLRLEIIKNYPLHSAVYMILYAYISWFGGILLGAKGRIIASRILSRLLQIR